MDLITEIVNPANEVLGKSAATIEAVFRAWGTVKGALQTSEIGADSEVKLAMSELTGQIADAKFANAELKNAFIDMQAKLREIEAFKTDLDRYALWETPAGAIVYRLSTPHDDLEPMHYLCPNCISDRRKSVLQGHSEWRKCPTCKTGYSFAPGGGSGAAVIAVRNSRWDGF